MRLADRLRASLARDPAHTVLLRGDSHAALEVGEPFVPAAVLVAVVERDDPGVLLTRRSPNLRKHAGQIAFPGGRIDPEDDGPVDGALREAWEEIGLDRTLVDIVGLADHYRTGTGYDITPVIGVVQPGFGLMPHDAEVAEIFEAPLSFLLDRANHERRSVVRDGRAREYYRIDWQGRVIWGATAAMIVNLGERLRDG